MQVAREIKGPFSRMLKTLILSVLVSIFPLLKPMDLEEILMIFTFMTVHLQRVKSNICLNLKKAARAFPDWRQL